MERIEELHEASWKGLKIILQERIKNYKVHFCISFFLSVIQFLNLIIYSKDSSFGFLSKSVDLCLSYYPNLLGFSLGGFAIVVGFSNVDLIKKASKFDSPSVYQILNASFTFVILLQILLTSFAFVIKWIINLEIAPFVSCNTFLLIINTSIISMFLFFSIFLVFLTFDVVINLFSLSQTNNLFFTVKKKVEQNKTSK